MAAMASGYLSMNLLDFSDITIQLSKSGKNWLEYG
jgi:hypothetical protein